MHSTSTRPLHFPAKFHKPGLFELFLNRGGLYRCDAQDRSRGFALLMFAIAAGVIDNCNLVELPVMMKSIRAE